jgi:hypothetical protein
VNYPLLNVFLTMLWFFGFCLWIYLVVWTLMLIIRRRDLSGWAKAAWVVLVIFVPLIGILAYLITRSDHLADDRIGAYGEPPDEAYARMESPGHNNVDDLAKLADLRDRGVITNEEFQKGKIQLLG